MLEQVLRETGLPDIDHRVRFEPDDTCADDLLGDFSNVE
jgi:hypothetical protein